MTKYTILHPTDTVTQGDNDLMIAQTCLYMTPDNIVHMPRFDLISSDVWVIRSTLCLHNAPSCNAPPITLPFTIFFTELLMSPSPQGIFGQYCHFSYRHFSLITKKNMSKLGVSFSRCLGDLSLYH